MSSFSTPNAPLTPRGDVGDILVGLVVDHAQQPNPAAVDHDINRVAADRLVAGKRPKRGDHSDAKAPRRPTADRRRAHTSTGNRWCRWRQNVRHRISSSLSDAGRSSICLDDLVNAGYAPGRAFGVLPETARAGLAAQRDGAPVVAEKSPAERSTQAGLPGRGSVLRRIRSTVTQGNPPPADGSGCYSGVAPPHRRRGRNSQGWRDSTS